MNQEKQGSLFLTGSHRLELRAAISQSLASRTGILHLLPFSIQELKAANIGFDTVEEAIYTASFLVYTTKISGQVRPMQIITKLI